MILHFSLQWRRYHVPRFPLFTYAYLPLTFSPPYHVPRFPLFTYAYLPLTFSPPPKAVLKFGICVVLRAGLQLKYNEYFILGHVPMPVECVIKSRNPSSVYVV